jgi:threonine 3-dehydrogenase
MLANMAHGGRVAVLGIPTEPIPVDFDLVIFNGLTLKGVYGREMYETWYAMTAMLQSGLDVSAVITHRFPALDFAEALKTAGGDEAGKVILDWEQI